MAVANVVQQPGHPQQLSSSGAEARRAEDRAQRR